MRFLIIPTLDYSGDLHFSSKVNSQLSVLAPNLEVLPIGAITPLINSILGNSEDASDVNMPENNKALSLALTGMIYATVLEPSDMSVDVVIGFVPRSIEMVFDEVYVENKELTNTQILAIERELERAGSPVEFYKGDDATFSGSMEDIVFDIQRRAGSLPTITS